MATPTPSKPVYFETPDGVKRELRFTFGARKRIVDRFGMQIVPALNKYDLAALPELLYCLMFDEDGNPPENLNIGRWIENQDLARAPEMMVTLMDAVAQGRAEKKELEALERMIRAGMEEQIRTLTGSISGPSDTSASASPSENSGGSQSESSTPSSSDGPKTAVSVITAPA